ncbi:unnamed protein product, partial [Linum tenue]
MVCRVVFFLWPTEVVSSDCGDAKPWPRCRFLSHRSLFEYALLHKKTQLTFVLIFGHGTTFQFAGLPCYYYPFGCVLSIVETQNLIFPHLNNPSV